MSSAIRQSLFRQNVVSENSPKFNNVKVSRYTVALCYKTERIERASCPLLSRLNYDVICVIKQHVRGKENSFSLIIEWSHLSGNPGPPVRYSDEL